jgi:hypothetical protein
MLPSSLYPKKTKKEDPAISESSFPVLLCADSQTLPSASALTGACRTGQVGFLLLSVLRREYERALQSDDAVEHRCPVF